MHAFVNGKQGSNWISPSGIEVNGKMLPSTFNGLAALLSSIGRVLESTKAENATALESVIAVKSVFGNGGKAADEVKVYYPAFDEAESVKAADFREAAGKMTLVYTTTRGKLLARVAIIEEAAAVAAKFDDTEATRDNAAYNAYKAIGGKPNGIHAKAAGKTRTFDTV